MKVVIVGAHGMLGLAMTEQFKKAHEVFAWDKNDIDITDFPQTSSQINAVNPELLINAAAHNALDLIETNPEIFDLAKILNGFAVGNLAAIARELDIPVVHFSTDYIFDGSATASGYSETDTPNPVSKYAETKLLGEQELQKNTDKFYLVRLSRLFGPAGTSVGAKKSFVDVMLDLVERQGKTEFKLVHEETASPSYSKDVAEFVHELVSAAKPYGIYHAANSGECTWHEFAQEVFRLKGWTIKTIPVPSSEFPRPAQRPVFSVLRNTKTPPQRSWQEALGEYLLG